MKSTNAWTSASQLYSFVLDDSDADPRLKRSFERIRVVCDEIENEARIQAKRGARFSASPIFISEVGRRCVAKFGGPSGISIIRNRATEPLKAIYIDLRASELELPQLSGERSERLAGISDLAVRAYVGSLEQKIKICEATISGLTSTLKKIRPISLDAALAASHDHDALDVTVGVQQTPPHSDIAAVITHLLKAEHLAAFGLVFDRAVYNPSTGEEFLTAKQVATLLTLVGHNVDKRSVMLPPTAQL